MTRETRIGLIVGLAFIVLFGVVLSGLGTTSDAPQGQLDRGSREFYADVPVTHRHQPQPKGEEHALVIVEQRRPAAQESATGTRRTERPTRSARPTRPTSAGGRNREMTPEEFAAANGVRVPAGHYRTYTTRRGDNLTALARKFYRTPSRAAVMKIYNANRNVLRSPDSLGVGVKLRIPK
jgi:nucleoid-associated protein YgaU